MKLPRLSFAVALVLVSAVTSSGQANGWVDKYGMLLGKYATSNGVKYAAWKGNAADVAALAEVVDAIGKEKVGSLGKKEQLAFYINAYNAWILNETLEKYPTKSVKDALFTFFTSKRITVAGEQTSFKRLEDDVIRAKFGDPGIHFALNCASRSCPPLDREPFTAGKLDSQLERLARGYINSDNGVRYDEASKTAQLSKIFEWYKDDFKDGGPIAYINKRRTKPLPNDVKITYQDYDWALNEAR
ncbi:MAG: DUF547 domain-containing protein [Limisphaerales bacterium]